jgi:transporter family-2 protein
MAVGRAHSSAHAASPVTATALGLAVLVGAAMSLQVYVNGHLGKHLGSPELAGMVNNLGGLAALVAVAVATGAMQRGTPHLKRANGLTWWHVAAGCNGALFIVVTAAAAPKVGVALLTVALVCGQTVGSLLVDRVGLSPAGRQAFSVPRLLGVGLAIAAVVVGALGTHGELHLLLLSIAVVAGAGVAVQQAAIGQVARISGEPFVAGVVNFTVGSTAVVLLVLLVTGTGTAHGWDAPPQQWLGGLIGASVVLIIARVVRVLGVLRLMLCVVAGQTTFGLLLDLVDPAPGKAVTAATVLGVLLTIVAVGVSGGLRRRRAPAPAPAPPPAVTSGVLTDS